MAVLLAAQAADFGLDPQPLREQAFHNGFQTSLKGKQIYVLLFHNNVSYLLQN